MLTVQRWTKLSRDEGQEGHVSDSGPPHRRGGYDVGRPLSRVEEYRRWTQGVHSQGATIASLLCRLTKSCPKGIFSRLDVATGKAPEPLGAQKQQKPARARCEHDEPGSGHRRPSGLGAPVPSVCNMHGPA